MAFQSLQSEYINLKYSTKELIPRDRSFSRTELENQGFCYAGEDIPGLFIFEIEGVRLYFKKTGNDLYQIFSLSSG